MTEPIPIVLIPGLFSSPRLYADQISPLWRYGPVTLADHTRDDSMAAIARRILSTAPPRFALAGLSMGGYIAFEVMRQAPERVVKLALLDTAAHPDTAEQATLRCAQIELARNGRYSEIPEALFPRLVHPSRHNDEALRQTVRLMAEETGAEAFIRQQTAIMNRPDSRPGLGAIACPTLVLVGDHDELTPPDRAREIAGAIGHARLVVVPDSGHLSTLEQPQRATQALVEWLEG
jgi:pimeloyl-ACP methyl ester carboxylesterase